MLNFAISFIFHPKRISSILTGNFFLDRLSNVSEGHNLLYSDIKIDTILGDMQQKLCNSVKNDWIFDQKWIIEEFYTIKTHKNRSQIWRQLDKLLLWANKKSVV